MTVNTGMSLAVDEKLKYKIDSYDFEQYRFKVSAFFETQCRW